MSGVIDLKQLGSIIYKLLQLFYKEDEFQEELTPKPFVSFRSFGMFRRYLVCFKSYLLERIGSFLQRGQERCKVCNNINAYKRFVIESSHTALITTLTVAYLLTYKFHGKITNKFGKRVEYSSCFIKTILFINNNS